MESAATEPRSLPRPVLLGLLAAAVLLGALGASAWAVLKIQRAEVPGFLGGATGAPVRQAEVARRPAGGIALAGSGSNLPLTRSLAAAFQSDHAEIRVLIHDSIGSSGGVRAVRDGVIDLGLISRPLSPEEQRWGLRVAPYARVPVVVAANPSVPDDGLDAGGLLDLFRGARTRWSDGSPVVLFLRERGDSSHAAVAQRLPGFAEANEDAYRQQRWLVLFSDAAMHRTLQETPGAVGLLDLGQVNLQPPRLRVLALDGVIPSPESLATGVYPFFKDLAFVHHQPLKKEEAAFLDFTHSARAQELILSAGCLPIPEGEP
jgi:phosphate transport system substrate-binding protein